MLGDYSHVRIIQICKQERDRELRGQEHHFNEAIASFTMPSTSFVQLNHLYLTDVLFSTLPVALTNLFVWREPTGIFRHIPLLEISSHDAELANSAKVLCPLLGRFNHSRAYENINAIVYEVKG